MSREDAVGIVIASAKIMLKQIGLLMTCSLMFASCATAPKSDPERRALEANADATLQTMQANDPALRDVLRRSVGYAVFPEIGKGGFLVGGAYGRGIVYENGRKTGFVELNQASIGAVLGGQTFSELIVFSTPEALNRLRDGEYDVTGQASAVILKEGAAAATQFDDDGVGVFVMPKGGAMVDVSVAGQRLNFEPRG
jgi:lipid-binding SYLF domain-containing protein